MLWLALRALLALLLLLRLRDIDRLPLGLLLRLPPLLDLQEHAVIELPFPSASALKAAVYHTYASPGMGDLVACTTCLKGIWSMSGPCTHPDTQDHAQE